MANRTLTEKIEAVEAANRMLATMFIPTLDEARERERSVAARAFVPVLKPPRALLPANFERRAEPTSDATLADMFVDHLRAHQERQDVRARQVTKLRNVIYRALRMANERGLGHDLREQLRLLFRTLDAGSDLSPDG